MKFSMADIKRINEEKGFFWFSKDTLRFFGSRVGSAVFNGPNGVYFVSSEYKGPNTRERGFTVRKFDPETGNISTVGDFNEFRTLGQAKEQAKRLACDYSK